MEHYEPLEYTQWECKYHLVWIPKWRKRVLNGQLRKELEHIVRGLDMTSEFGITGSMGGRASPLPWTLIFEMKEQIIKRIEEC